MPDKSILSGFSWNEVTEGFDSLQEVMVSILAFAPDRSLKLIGSAFIIEAHGNGAVAFTAAHNLSGVKRAQNPNPRHHPTALPEFLPPTFVSADPKQLRAVYQIGSRLEMCVVTWAAWDTNSEIGAIGLAPQDELEADLFHAHFGLGSRIPVVGDLVALLGYGDMAVLSEEREGERETATFQRRLVMRTGLVTAQHPNGHILCRSPCVETTIPVLGGMSGGAAFLVPPDNGPLVAFGLISSDPEEDNETKRDRSKAGASIVKVLPILMWKDADERTHIQMRIGPIETAKDAPSRPETLGEMAWIADAQDEQG